MIILLSSAVRKQYKEDILRSLAAPIGAKVRFRYRQDLIEPDLLETLNGASAIICFIDEKAVGQQGVFVVPVREAKIVAVHIHGSTRSIDLGLRGFVRATHEAAFQAALFRGGESVLPRFGTAGESDGSGYLVFKAEDVGHLVETGTSVSLWESVVARLSSKSAFSGEEYFWGVLDISEKASRPQETDSFAPVDKLKLLPGHYYRLLTYHYHPDVHRPQPTTPPMHVTHGTGIELQGPAETTVDSDYDLKEIAFRVSNDMPITRRTWVRIGPKDKWTLALELRIRGALPLISFGLIAVSLAAPPILRIISDNLYVLAIGPVLAAIIVAGAAVFGVRRGL